MLPPSGHYTVFIMKQNLTVAWQVWNGGVHGIKNYLNSSQSTKYVTLFYKIYTLDD